MQGVVVMVVFVMQVKVAIIMPMIMHGIVNTAKGDIIGQDVLVDLARDVHPESSKLISQPQANRLVNHANKLITPMLQVCPRVIYVQLVHILIL